MRGRCSSAGIPSMCASDVSCPGPQPSIARPRVRWSSSTMRSASIKGLWYGSELTPRAELDVLGSLRGDGDEHLGRRDDLEPGGVVLADPRLVEPEAVHRARSARGLARGRASGSARRVEGRQEVSEAHPPILDPLPRSLTNFRRLSKTRSNECANLLQGWITAPYIVIGAPHTPTRAEVHST